MKSIRVFTIFIVGLVMLTLLLLAIAPTVKAAPSAGRAPGIVVQAPALQTQEGGKKLADLVLEVGGLSVFLFAFVAWIKQLGVSGNLLTISAFLFGLVFGVMLRYAQAPLITFADWFWAVAFGLLAGFLATGAYKGAESVAKTSDRNLISVTSAAELIKEPIPHSTEE